MDDTEEVIQHYSKYPRPTRLERRIPLYFEEWVKITRLEEEHRSKEKQTEFGPLGAGGEEDEEAWAQWFEYIEWVAEGQPDVMDEVQEPGEEAESAGADEADGADQEVDA
jgi:hypothetical protein